MLSIILLLLGLLELFHANGYYRRTNIITVYPKYQMAKEYEDVVIDCAERDNGKVFWNRRDGLLLPKQALQHRGRLSIHSIKHSDGGWYLCFNEDKTHKAEAFISVHRTSTDGYDGNLTRTYSFVTGGLPTTISPVNFVTLVTNTPYPCTYGICNGTCCKEDLTGSYFDCSNGQKINKSLVCNRENDCDDGSDESTCRPWPPKITVLPKRKVEIFCGDQEKALSEALTLECKSVGHPTPVVMWKKYDGHVPSKCQQYSKHGHGILTCPDFQQSDQGAYSCVAKNTVKLAESQPQSIAKCINTINCKGFRVVNEEKIEHCLECYCSGKSSQCQSIKSNSTVKKLPFPKSKTEIFAAENGEIVFIPTESDLAPTPHIRKSAQEIIYCTLTKSDFEEISFLKSFGRNIVIPRHKGKTDFSTKAPDLIIRGNNISLTYRVNLISYPKESLEYISARFWPGNWHHVNNKSASRQDLMKVLSNVDTMFVRCEYQQGHPVSWENATISLESSVITDFAAPVSYVEKCLCPAGYDGLSCETCADGYKKKSQGSDFICEKVYVPPACKEGQIGAKCETCDAAKGYVKKGKLCIKPTCHPDGSIPISSNSTAKCVCRMGVRGEFCDECEDGYFHLSSGGCRKCWCSGVTKQCKSSNLQRSVISNTPRGGYNSSDGRNFWLLPSDFSGNRLTSYGGHLNYTMKYKPNISKQDTILTVEFLTTDDVTLTYTHTQVDKSTLKNDKSWSVPIIETDWKKSDKTSVNRGEFLAMLSKMKAVYIESPYHLSSGMANLTSTLMSSASSGDSGDATLALAVEECNCPRGYTGLSCESCSDGYYKKRNGIVIQCIKCNCSNCDPEFGCPDCPGLTYRDNPEYEKMPVCKPCPCNGNGISCVKDDLNQIFCRCKSGFSGMHCENIIPKETDGEFTVTISPRKIRGKKVGTAISLNCSFSSGEEMVLLVKKTYSPVTNSRLTSNFSYAGTITKQERKSTKTFEVLLEDGLEAIECFVHDTRGKLAGHVVAAVENLITVVKPVKISNCYSARIDVKESESRDIICEATGSPTPTVTWYRLENGTRSVSVDTSEGVHTIESTSLKDNGTIYTCIAENSEGEKATCTKVLFVQKKCEVINIFPKTVRVEERKNISVECKTTAKSPVTWSLLGSNLGEARVNFSARVKVNGGHLQIINSEVSDSGTYICSANGENGIKINKTVSVVVEEKKIAPTALIREYDKVLNVGESLDVICTGTGKPAPHITWRKLKGPLDSNVVVSGNTLEIRKAVSTNSGIYECEARSILGKDTSYISIGVEQINFPPRVNISEENIKVHDGDEVTLTCLAVGYPRPRLIWFAPNVTFINVSSANDSMVLIEPQKSVKEEITFKVTKEMDGVTITCIAESRAGRSEKRAAVKVLQSKGSVNETVEFVTIGSYFELICDFTGDLKLEKNGGLVGDECPIPYGLMIQSVQIQHNGTYICKAHSDSKKIINLIVVGFVPKFSSHRRSFLVLPATLKSSHELRVEITFNPTNENGLILIKDNHKFAIYLEKNKILLSIHTNGGGLLEIKTQNPIQLHKWFSLVVTITKNYVDITVYNEKSSIHERKIEDSKNSNISMGHGKDNFFAGGYTFPRHHMGLFSKINRRFSHFNGCISRLKINDHEYHMVKEGSYSQNVTLCKRCFEEPNLCHENGKCLDAPTQYGFICVCPYEQENKGKTCPPSCVGKGCETQLNLCALLNPCTSTVHECIGNTNNLQCNCVYGYTGTTCERVQEHSFCVKGNGFVRLPSNFLERRIGESEIIKMAFTLHQSNGQLLWQGDDHNHLSIAVVDGIVGYTYLNQHSKLSVQGANKLEINKKHTLALKRVNGTVSLELNAPKIGTETYRNSTTTFNTNRVAGDIYLGNVPNRILPSSHHVGLHGCIHYVSFGDKSKINLWEEEFEKFSVFKSSKPLPASSESDDESDDNNDVDNYND